MHTSHRQIRDQANAAVPDFCHMYAHSTKIQPTEGAMEDTSSGRASARTGTGLLDQAGEEVCQGLVVGFLVAWVCRGAFFLLGSAGFSVLDGGDVSNGET